MIKVRDTLSVPAIESNCTMPNAMREAEISARTEPKFEHNIPPTIEDHSVFLPRIIWKTTKDVCHILMSLKLHGKFS